MYGMCVINLVKLINLLVIITCYFVIIFTLGLNPNFL